MNYFDKPKIMGLIILALLVLNFGTLSFMWINRPPKPEHERMHEGPGPEHIEHPGHPGEFLIHELKLNDTQQKDFEKLRDEHQKQMKQVFDDIRKNKDELFAMLSNPAADTNKISGLTDNIAKGQKQIELATYDHFKKVRALCDDNQKKKFDEIIGDVLKMMAMQPPGSPPPDGQKGPPPPGMEKKPPPK